MHNHEVYFTFSPLFCDVSFSASDSLGHKTCALIMTDNGFWRFFSRSFRPFYTFPPSFRDFPLLFSFLKQFFRRNGRFPNRIRQSTSCLFSGSTSDRQNHNSESRIDKSEVSENLYSRRSTYGMERARA